MPQNLVQKIFDAHLISGEMKPGQELAIRIDQTLTQDATGTMAYLQFEAMGIPKVRTDLSVSYVDHNMLQTGFENADDHRFLQSIAAKYGIYFSRPGNGICHQVHLERFAVPGKTLLGSDSHTPTCGGLGMIAVGAGGLDVAVAMGGGPFYLAMPEVWLVRLVGKRQNWVAAKDIIFELLRRLTVKGGVGKIIEYGGPGVADLSVPERGTITNMGAELGATTSIFPSDKRTREYMQAQGRENEWVELMADPDAEYDGVIEIDLNDLEPLISRPHSPDNVVPVSEVAGTPVTQVLVGSCTNSSFVDLQTVAGVLKGKTVHPDLSFGVTPGSRQVYTMIARSGALGDLIESGARILESACGPCIGMGQAPSSGAVSVRSFNRNFEGRSGTPNAQVFLASPETCAASALTGVITDPRTLGPRLEVDVPEKYLVEDNMIMPPAEDPDTVEVVRGPNIRALPINKPMGENVAGQVLLKVGDNITTDHIMPAGAKVLPLRSNIPAISEYVFEKVDPSFATRAQQQGGGLVVGGSNYGQGSSREHAALAPMYLGVRGVLTKSFARIHRDNLINFGILPMTFVNPEDYDNIQERDELVIEGAREMLSQGVETLTVRNLTKDTTFEVKPNLSPRQVKIIRAGGLLNFIRQQGDASKIEREATAAAVGTTTALPTKTTKVTETPGAMPKPLSRAELFDQLVVERANRDATEHDKLGHGLHEKADRRMAEIVAPKSGDYCLDVATASGNLAIALAKRVGPEGKVLAIDLAEGMIEFASRKARAHKIRNVDFVRMDAQKLEFEDSTFDVVTCGLALFYFPDIEGALNEMLRVLKPGGRLGVSSADAENAFSPLSEPYMAGLRKASDVLQLNPPAYSDVAVLTRRQDTLEGLIKQAGFEHVEVHEEDIPVRFNSFEDWWAYGRGSTWGEILLDQMGEEQRTEFQHNHKAEVEKLFGEEGVKTATPVLFGVAVKPKK
jgi:aconitate hydratase